MSRELLQELRSIADQISKLGNGDLDGNSDGNVLAQHARKLLDAELARHEWVKFTDALPIVPEGDSVVYILTGTPGDTRIYYAIWYGDDDSADNYTKTHWTYQPRPYTPQPPRSES